MVGVVTHKHPEYYRVDINAPELATLRWVDLLWFSYSEIAIFSTLTFSAMAFESATKRNRVNVQVGDIGKRMFKNSFFTQMSPWERYFIFDSLDFFLSKLKTNLKQKKLEINNNSSFSLIKLV